MAQFEIQNLPPFASEAEEAAWWYENREKHAAEFVQADKDGRLKVNIAAKRLARAQGRISLKLETEEKRQAAEFAGRRGMTVEMYLHHLVHEGLERETAA